MGSAMQEATISRGRRKDRVLDANVWPPGTAALRAVLVTDAPIILNTFALSHYCEIVRWALDYKGAPYEEQSWAPFLHVFRTWRFEQTTTPILRVDGRTLQESTDICAFLEERFTEPTLIPQKQRDAVFALADDARGIGEHVRRLSYLALGKDVRAMRDSWEMNVSPSERRWNRRVFPISRRLVFKRFEVTEEAGATSEATVRQFLDRYGELLSDGRRYLVGDSFSLADLTMSAMLSPLARPPEHPFYSTVPLGPGIDDLVESFRGHPTLEWVLGCYRRHRGGPGATAQERTAVV